MKANQFYCVACRKKVMIDDEDICEVKLKNGRHALRAYCAKCDCHLTKFISNKSVSRMTSKFGKCKKSKKRSKSKKSKKSKRKSRKSRRKSRC